MNPESRQERNTALPANQRSARILTVAAYAASAASILIFLAMAFLRLRYPYEIEWLEGAFMDHVMRLRDGLPIYAAPSIRYVPYLYTPLYYYVGALFISIFGEGFFAVRLVSFLSSLVSAGLIYRIIYRDSDKSNLFAISGAAMFFAAAGFAGFYYDLVRMDMFMVLLLLLATYCALRLSGLSRILSTALFLVLAYYTKQQALFAVPVLFLWLFLHKKRDALLFVLFYLVGFSLLFLYFQTNSAGWFYYYCFTIPKELGKNFHLRYALTVLPSYVLRFWLLLFLSMGAVFMGGPTSFREKLRAPLGLLVLLTLGMFVSGIVSMGNLMGYVNLSMPFVAFASVLFPIALHRLVSERRISYSIALCIMLLEIGMLSYKLLDEKAMIPGQKERKAGEQFLEVLRAIPGEVFIPDHGYLVRMVGKAPHAQSTAIRNLLDMHDTLSRNLQHDLDSAYRTERFAAIILDTGNYACPDSVPGYRRAKTIFQQSDVFLSREGSLATEPDFVYLPKHPTAPFAQ